MPRSAVGQVDARGRARARPRSACRRSCGPASRWAAQGGGIARTEAEYRERRGRGPRRQPDRPGAGRGVGDRLGRVRARGDARPQRQRGDRLLDRERRPDGRAHRRLASPSRRSRRSPTASTRSCATRRITVIRAVGVETGGSNIQFAVNPQTDEIVVIEMNPRVSRSSALASKATGFPIAKIAARLAVGYALEEIDNDITRRHAGELRAHDRLRGGQVAALRLREVPRRGRPAAPPTCSRWARRWRSGAPSSRPSSRRCARASSTWSRAVPRTPTSCSRALETPSHDRYELLFEAVRARRAARPSCARAPGIDPWFMAELARARRAARTREAGLARTYKAVDTCAAEFEAETPYYYSGWERPARRPAPRGAPRRPRQRGDPRLGPQPHRAGHRVRLLLRARGDDRARVGPRRGDGQLQPGDGLHRLRHLATGSTSSRSRSRTCSA